MLNKISAPSSKCKFTLLSKWIGPVKNLPTGITTLPPPFLVQASIAFLKASELFVSPPLFAP